MLLQKSSFIFKILGIIFFFDRLHLQDNPTHDMISKGFVLEECPV